MHNFFVETKQLTRAALPVMVIFLAQKSLQFVDALMLGRMGPEALAAGALGSTIFLIALMFCLGTLSVIGAYISRAFGLNTKREIRKTMQHSFFIVLILSIPSMVVLWLAPSFLRSLGEDLYVVNAANLFLHGLVWGFPAMLGFLVLREFISAFSLSRVILYITLAAMPLTCLADYLLIYGKLGLPTLGVAGVGYAGALIQWFMLGALLIYIYNHSLLKSYLFYFNFRELQWEKLLEMLRMGMPYGVLLVLDLGMGSLAMLMMGYFGVEALAAYYIVVQCTTIAFTLPFSFSMAAAQRVGQFTEGANFYYINKITMVSLCIGLAVACLTAGLFLLFPGFLVKIFVGDNTSYSDALKFAPVFFALAAIFYYFDAVQAILNGVLRGLKDTFLPMVSSIVCYWVIGIGGAYCFTFYFALNTVGIWYGLILGIASTAAVLFIILQMRVMLWQHY